MFIGGAGSMCGTTFGPILANVNAKWATQSIKLIKDKKYIQIYKDTKTETYFHTYIRFF